MKKIFAVLTIILLLFILCSCHRTMYTTEDLVKQVQKEFSLSDSATNNLSLAGTCTNEPFVFLWFISGNGYPSNANYLMECSIGDNGGYVFERTYNNQITRSEDIFVQPWQSGYIFCVNNPRCTTIRITDVTGTRDISIDEGAHPFILFNKYLPSEYLFLDADGNEL